MSDQELDQAIRKYLSIYNNYQIDENIDENIVNNFTRLIRDHSNMFNYLAELLSLTLNLNFRDIFFKECCIYSH